jgi:YHS domain-containing protein
MKVLFELVPYVLLFLIVRSMIRGFLANQRKVGNAPRSSSGGQPPVAAGGELKKDPVCGTYVSTTASFTRNAHGEVLYFCSKECRDKFRS